MGYLLWMLEQTKMIPDLMLSFIVYSNQCISWMISVVYFNQIEGLAYCLLRFNVHVSKFLSLKMYSWCSYAQIAHLSLHFFFLNLHNII